MMTIPHSTAMLRWILHALDPVQAVCSNWCLHFWEVVGIWFTGLATFAVVLVSLALARRAEPRLKVSVDQRVIIDPAKVRDPANVRLEDFPDVIVLTVANVGPTRVRVNSVGWHWILIRGKGALQNPPLPKDRSHSDWPTILEHGDQLQWVLELKYLVNSIATNMLAGSWWWRLKLELLCVTVETTTEHRFRGRIGPTLKKAFAAEVERLLQGRSPR